MNENKSVNNLDDSYKRVQRMLARKKEGIDVPWLAGLYREWMQTDDGKKPTVANSYMHYLRSLDREVFSQQHNGMEIKAEDAFTGGYLKEKDFFYMLRHFWTNELFDSAKNWFDLYLKLVDAEVELAKRKESSIRQKDINNWRSAFRNYHKFFVEYLIPSLKNEMNKEDSGLEYTHIENSDKNLYRELDFVEWMQENEDMGMHSAQSYVSNIKRANREIFNKNKKGINVLAYIAELLRTGKEAKANQLLTALETELTRRINKKDESAIPLFKLSQCRTAFRKYVRFIEEETIEVSENEEEWVTQADEESRKTESESTIYEYDDMDDIFYLRLITQNRFGKIFYPISLLKRLFHLSQKISKLQSADNGRGSWFNRWLDDCIANIEVLTDKGDYILADIDELEIDPQSKRVTVTLPDMQKATLWTETEKGEKVPVQAEDIRDIHIDHTPLIARFLSEYAEELLALPRLTTIIQECARQKNITVTDNKSLHVITNELLDNPKRFLELERMIPQLKNELCFISDEITLKLMSAKYNLKKKK